MTDEVCIKPVFLYQGGTMFGKAVNNLHKLATTVLFHMIQSLFAGPEFLTKVLPIAKLDTEFHFEQCQPIIETINQIKNVKVLAILADSKAKSTFFQNI